MELNKISKIPCTIAVLTHNSSATLRRALASAQLFQEIIVCDGNSSDNTPEIALAYGAKIISQDPAFLEKDRIKNFAGVRNQTLQIATFPWFFFLDADESLSEPLVHKLKEIISEGSPPAAYYVHRRYELESEIIACASTYPNRNMRFFHKDAVMEFIKPVHERIELKREAIVKDLGPEAFIIVPVRDTPAASRRKNREYIEIEIERIQSLSLPEWFRRSFHRLLVSGKYALRTIKGHLFCKGKAFPLSYEINRHWYHLVLSYRELSRVGWKTKLRN